MADQPLGTLEQLFTLLSITSLSLTDKEVGPVCSKEPGQTEAQAV